jgi:hypothetical protein
MKIKHVLSRYEYASTYTATIYVHNTQRVVAVTYVMEKRFTALRRLAVRKQEAVCRILHENNLTFLLD